MYPQQNLKKRAYHKQAFLTENPKLFALKRFHNDKHSILDFQYNYRNSPRSNWCSNCSTQLSSLFENNKKAVILQNSRVPKMMMPHRLYSQFGVNRENNVTSCLKFEEMNYLKNKKLKEYIYQKEYRNSSLYNEYKSPSFYYPRNDDQCFEIPQKNKNYQMNRPNSKLKNLAIQNNVNFIKEKIKKKSKKDEHFEKKNHLIDSSLETLDHLKKNISNFNTIKKMLISILDDFKVTSLINTLLLEKQQLSRSESLVFTISKKDNVFEEKMNQSNRGKIEYMGKDNKEKLFSEQVSLIIGRLSECSLHDKVKFLNSSDLNLIRLTHIFQIKTVDSKKYSKLTPYSSKQIEELSNLLFDFKVNLQDLFQMKIKRELFLISLFIYKSKQMELLTPVLTFDMQKLKELKRTNKLSFPLVCSVFLVLISHFLVPPKLCVFLKFVGFLLFKNFPYLTDDLCLKIAEKGQIKIVLDHGMFDDDLYKVVSTMSKVVEEFQNEKHLISLSQKALFANMNRKFGLLSLLNQFLNLIILI